MDRPFVELMERVYHRFKNALFDYYLGSAPAADEETALVINNYKELIRIQDADQRLLQLVQMAAGGAGIEQVEEFASKDKELEALAKKVTELEQDVFDWKGRFSEKEEALRARDQAFEQVSTSWRRRGTSTRRRRRRGRSWRRRRRRRRRRTSRR